MNLKGRNAIVTGGSHGIGKSICLDLAKSGCNILFISRNKRYNCYKLKEEIIKDYGVHCDFIEADCSNADEIKKIIFISKSILNRIDILVNNVGGGSSWGNETHWHKTNDFVWKESIDINYLSSVYFTNAFLQDMMDNNYGRVISISSIYGKEGGGNPWFQSSKTALISLMKSYSNNLKYTKNNITFNTICPGFVKIEGKKINKDVDRSHITTPDKISPLVAFLCTQDASFINGACITVDGGYTKSF